MRALATGAVLVAAFAAALLIGKGSGGQEQAATAAEVKALEAPGGSMNAPPLADTGSIPDLKPKPQPASTDTGSTAGTTSSGTTPSTSTTPSTGGGGGGGGTTPPPPVPR